MMTVAQAFEQFLQSLELTEDAQAKASNQQTIVRKNLDDHLGGLDRHFLSGSYGRRTAIQPLNDIDLFLVLKKQAHSDIYPPNTPDKCLQKVQRALAAAYPNKDVAKIQGRSVNIEFIGTGIAYDVVPAFLISGNDYMIPDRDRKNWIRTNPEKHKEVCIAANARAGSKLNKLIKAAKHWNQKNGRLLRSFHLEVMAYGAFTAGPSSYPAGFHALLAYLAEAVARSCPDPVGIGPNIDQGMTPQERTPIQAALRAAAAEAQKALHWDGQGRTEEAHGVWRRLLGNLYPEKGK